MVAAEHAWQAPERIGDHAEVRRGGGGQRVERRVGIARVRQHHQRPVRPDSRTERLDQPQRTPLDRPHGAESGMDEQDAARLNAERAKLLD
jgi:hypothetical protein